MADLPANVIKNRVPAPANVRQPAQVQATLSAASPTTMRVPAPPVYRPQTAPISGNSPVTNSMVTRSPSPPAYQPQQGQRTLQSRGLYPQHQQIVQAPRTPSAPAWSRPPAPPIYRPEAKRLVQPKAAIPLPTPVVRAAIAPPVIQRVIDPIPKAKKKLDDTTLRLRLDCNTARTQMNLTEKDQVVKPNDDAKAMKKVMKSLVGSLFKVRQIIAQFDFPTIVGGEGPPAWMGQTKKYYNDVWVPMILARIKTIGSDVGALEAQAHPEDAQPGINLENDNYKKFGRLVRQGLLTVKYDRRIGGQYPGSSYKIEQFPDWELHTHGSLVGVSRAHFKPTADVGQVGYHEPNKVKDTTLIMLETMTENTFRQK